MEQTYDEGYIKFDTYWKKTLPLQWNEIDNLIRCRQLLYHRNLIGAYPDGIGFGNISTRIVEDNSIVISGSATGRESVLTNEHFAIVKRADIAQNQLWCSGPVIASSESMSHWVIYQELDWVNAVIHVHHLHAWQNLLHQIPTTSAEAAYGTPEMADSIVDLIKNTKLPTTQIFVMEGHREGIFVFGRDLQDAMRALFNHVMPYL